MKIDGSECADTTGLLAVDVDIAADGWRGVLDDGIETFWNARLHDATHGHATPFAGTRHNILHTHRDRIDICASDG